MKIQLKVVIQLVALCIVTMLIFNNFIQKTEADDKVSKVNLSLSPKKQLFKVKNMKPGDWMPRTLLIQNTGEHDLEYQIAAKHKAGSKKLYNQLLITVSINDHTLYVGKLSELERLENRRLFQSEKEELLFTVEFPPESGNEYQGLKTEIVLTFSAEVAQDTAAGVTKRKRQSPESGSALPKTGKTVSAVFLTFSGIFLFMIGTVIFLRRSARETFDLISRGKGL